jgi:SP family sugar:H+ symporter-like MFS transporter
VQISSTDKWYQIMMGRFVAGLGVGALSLLVPMYQVCGAYDGHQE